jgi:hypothetical protein
MLLRHEPTFSDEAQNGRARPRRRDKTAANIGDVALGARWMGTSAPGESR